MIGRASRTRADRVPLCAEGLQLAVEAVEFGKLAPAICLRVYSGGRATSVGATLPVAHAAALAEAITKAAKRASEASLWAPASVSHEHDCQR